MSTFLLLVATGAGPVCPRQLDTYNVQVGVVMCVRPPYSYSIHRTPYPPIVAMCDGHESSRPLL
jgi:hypothetical protein